MDCAHLLTSSFITGNIQPSISWQQACKKVLYAFRYWLALSTLRSVLLNLSLTFLALCVCFLCAQSSLTGVTLQKSDRLPDQVESKPFKQGKFVFRGRKRILSQNKRWGANPFPCAVKQSLHSLLSKWHLIWFCRWSLRYCECFQDIYSVFLATLARYEGSRNLMSRHTPSCAHTQTVENILK